MKNRDPNNEELSKFNGSLATERTQEGINYFIEQILQGKLFFNFEKIKDLLELFGNSVVIIKNERIPVYVSQYIKFISQVMRDYPNLYQEELDFARQICFDNQKMPHPMQQAKKCLLIYNQPIGMDLMGRIGNLGKELFDINSTAGNLEISDLDANNLLKEANKFVETHDSKNLDSIQNLMKKQKDYPDIERFTENVNQIRILNQFKNASLEKSKAGPVEDVKIFLSGIQDTQSHIEYFCSFFHRLVHIKNWGNREYDDEYYRYNSKKFKKSSFLDMCERELNIFPELQKFLKDYCTTFKIPRNLRAHQDFGEARISPAGIITIIDKNTGEIREIDYNEKREKLISYGVFINKIKLYSNSPFDESEDVFISRG